jgi:hypothetical protein
VTESFVRSRKVPFDTGALTLDPPDSRSSGLGNFSAKDRLPLCPGSV